MAVQFKTPERCLLVQAALYISENKLPIPDAAYLSAPDHPVTCPKDLIRALRDSQIVASGSLFEAYRTSQIATDTILAFEPFSWPIIENVEIDAELWSEDRIDIANSRLIGKNDDVSRIYRVPPLDPDFLLDHAWGEDEKPVAVETAFIFSNITVSTADLFQLLAPPPGTIVEQKSKGGRPPKYNWEEFNTEIIVKADLDNLPETQAKLVADMASWCQEKWGFGNEPSESVLKEKIAPIYKHLRKAQKKKS
jgi:hypothetical protein